MRRLLFAIELYLNGFRNCWGLAEKLMRSIQEAKDGKLKDLGSFEKYLD